MIFTKPLDRLVLEGAKTQTRRPIKTRHDVIQPCTYKPGRHYAVQRHRGGVEVARIEILDTHREPLGQLDYPAARAEGFRTTDEFRAYWLRLHDRAWVARQREPCPHCTDGQLPATIGAPARWCPACDAEGDRLAELTPDLVAPRFEHRHADLLVWVVTFRLLDAPRLLHRDSSHGYTSNPHHALLDEPEAVDEITLQEFTKDADERWAGQPGRRADIARVLARSTHERAKRLLANGHDPADIVAVLEQTDRGLQLLERQQQEHAA